MDFIYAEELKKKFDVTGHFYELDVNNIIFKCRNRLDIKSKEYLEGNSPDIIVVMMNPGSSKPKSVDYVESKYSVSTIDSLVEQTLVDTKPDNTQYQIMRVMLEKNWNYATIINLSDLRNGNSSDFSKVFDTMSINNLSHPDSIFSDSREKELYFILNNYDNSNILIGWGNLTNQEEFMEKAIHKFKEYNLIGIKSNNCEYCYSHPSPQKQEQKVLWLENIIELLKT